MSEKALRQVPGIHSVMAVINKRPDRIKSFMIRDGDLKGEVREILDWAKKRNIPVKRVGHQSLDRISSGNQGVVAECDGWLPWPEKKIKASKQSILLALDEVEDPHNLGSMLRSAWTLAADGVILAKDQSVGVTPTVEKVACGATEYLPILQGANLPIALRDLKEEGFWVYGLSEKASKTLQQCEFAQKSVLVMGSEGGGMRSTVEAMCDELVCIPQSKDGQSLNVSVAAGIALYELLRQRKKPLTTST